MDIKYYLIIIAFLPLAVLLSGCIIPNSGNATAIPTVTVCPTLNLQDKTGPAPSISPAPEGQTKPWVRHDVEVGLMRTDPVTICAHINSGTDAPKLKGLYLYSEGKYNTNPRTDIYYPNKTLEFPVPVNTGLYFSIGDKKAHVIVVGDFDDGYAALAEGEL